jgi:hypothetical protein
MSLTTVGDRNLIRSKHVIHSVDDCYLKHPLVKWKVLLREKLLRLVPPHTCFHTPT